MEAYESCRHDGCAKDHSTGILPERLSSFLIDRPPLKGEDPARN